MGRAQPVITHEVDAVDFPGFDVPDVELRRLHDDIAILAARQR